MTAEGRMARGKENYEKNRFLNNPETMDYIETLPKAKPKEMPKEEKKDAKSTK